MAEFVKLKTSGLEKMREMDERLVSYNVEMTEVTGGTFWKAYTPEQIAGTEPFSVGDATDFASAYMNLMQVYPPIDLYNEKLRKLAKEFGPVWVRVSGTWATKTFYDWDGTGVIPEGYQNILTKEQWIGVLDFVKAINAKLLISVTNITLVFPLGIYVVLRFFFAVLLSLTYKGEEGASFMKIFLCEGER